MPLLGRSFNRPALRAGIDNKVGFRHLAETMY